MNYLIPALQANSQQDELGGKGRALASLSQAGLPVPDWVAVTPSALKAGLSTTQWQKLTQAKDAAAASEALAGFSATADFIHELNTYLTEQFPPATRFAVRSSAADEDGGKSSFAGQLESFLGVTRDAVLESIVAVWHSGYSQRVYSYRQENKLSAICHPPTVIIQLMVSAAASGVAFSADPVTGERHVVVISAVLGLAEPLVAGIYDADTYRVNRAAEIVASEIVAKPKKMVHSANGVAEQPVSETQILKPAITDEQICEVAALARVAADNFGCPQDIEWAIEEGRLYLLQSRPITSLGRILDPAARLVLWDNSNIAESYSGVTTPLTFSFAAHVYREVYRQFMLLMGVTEAKINSNQTVFASMLGLIQGRIYYNLLSWYRALALLPGFTTNRKFMEQMMGVKETLPDAMIADIVEANRKDRFSDWCALGKSLCGLIKNHWRLGSLIKLFYRRLDRALAKPQPPLEQLRAEELVDVYRGLEDSLLNRWDAPLVNDFFAMIYYGLARKLVQRWCGDSHGGLQNDLIACQGNIISAEPAQRMRAMAHAAAQDPALVEKLCSATLAEIRVAMRKHPLLENDYHAYLEKFGDRCLEELKLESPTLHDDPLPLLRSIGMLAGDKQKTSAVHVSYSKVALQRAEQKIDQSLAGKPGRRLLFRAVLKRARQRVRDRENLRFERTRVFGRVRRIFVELGKRFYAAGKLHAARDVFYLTTDEIINFVEGKAVTTRLQELVAMRKKEYADYRQQAAPADRFETRGAVYVANTFEGQGEQEPAVTIDGELSGTPCCPGVVTAKARVILNPREATIKSGEVLVAPRTDPGWIMLFPAAAALVVEFGSLLSHSAIVAREMGIPAVVSVSGATSLIHTGDLIRIDGSTGKIALLEKAR